MAGAVRRAGRGAGLHTTEFFIHHEDIRRAQPGWVARTLPEPDQSVLWGFLKVVGRGLVKPSGVPVRIGWEERAATLASGAGPVVVRGLPSELALMLFGRGEVADVSYDGTPEAVARFRETDLGL